MGDTWGDKDDWGAEQCDAGKRLEQTNLRRGFGESLGYPLGLSTDCPSQRNILYYLADMLNLMINIGKEILRLI